MENFGYAPAEMALLDMGTRLLVALVLGAVIGIDREAMSRPAGLRTHMLVALAAAAFTIITFEMSKALLRAQPELTGADPIRIIEAVTAGVAFLAAGTIIHRRGSVEGLTTGAGLWLAGAIGLAAGAGLYAIAGLAALLALLVLTALRMFTPEARN
jgi:putative Mg2+ transporter-C (MgtC) family protein